MFSGFSGLRATWQDAIVALGDRDSDAFCALLSDKARRQILDSARRGTVTGVNSCQTAWAKIFTRFGPAEQRTLRASKLLTVEVNGDTATTIDSTQGPGSTSWAHIDGQWRIDDAGF